MARLWKAVLYQAMLDHNNGKDTNYMKLDNKDFLMVCDLAGITPQKAIERAYYIKGGF